MLDFRQSEPRPERREPRPPERQRSIKDTAKWVLKSLGKVVASAILREALGEVIDDPIKSADSLFDDLQVELETEESEFEGD